MRCSTLPTRGRVNDHRYFFASVAPPLAFASFLHWLMNFLRSLPCRPLSSASLEQASDSGVRGFSAFLAGAVAAGAAAGAVPCASAEPAKNNDAMATAARREEIFIMEAPLRRERATTSRCDTEPWMNGILVARDIFAAKLLAALSPMAAWLGCRPQTIPEGRSRMSFQTRLLCAVAASSLAAFAMPAQALTSQECSAKYQNAKAAGTLNGMKWNDFRKSQCSAEATPAAAPAAAPAPAPTTA